MDLQDQLKKLFPNHEFKDEHKENHNEETKKEKFFIQKEPIICKYEKKGRNGKPVTLLENYEGTDEDFKLLTKEIKSKLGVGGSFKDGVIVIQGSFRDKIMEYLKSKGFKVKRVGG